MLAGGTRILTALVASDPPCEPCGLVARWTPRSISAILACVPENSPASAPAPARAHAKARTFFLLGVIAAVALFAALGSIRPVFDPDAPWHLRTGEWILEHGSIPRVDPFSHTYAGKPWHFVDWGGDVLLAAIYGKAGLDGLEALGALLAALAVVLVALTVVRVRARALPWLLLAVGLLLSYAASAVFFTPRPQTFAWVLAALEMLLVVRVDERPSWGRLLAVPALLVLWSNLSSSVSLGVALFVLFALGTLLRCAWERQPGWQRVAVRVFVVGLLAAVAMFASPNPLGRLAAVHGLGASRSLAFISEWQPTEASALLGPLGAIALLVILGIALDRARVQPWELLLVLASGWMISRHVRMIPLAAFVAGPIGYRHLLAALPARVPRLAALAWLDGPVTAILLLAAFATALVFDRPNSWLGQAQRPRSQWSARVLPIGAAAFLRQERVQGPLFNTFHFGGYLMHEVPDLPVFIDGRTRMVYDDNFFLENLSIDHSPDPAQIWRPLFSRYGVQVAVVAPSRTSRTLAHDPDWTLVFIDDIAHVYVRRAGSNAALAERLAYRQLGGGPEATAASDPRAAFAAPGLLAELDRAIAQSTATIALRVMRAQARTAQGDQAGAEADLREATRLAPDLAYLWVRLGSFLAGQGRLVEARRALTQAVARAPEDQATRVLLAVALETAGDHEAAVATLRSMAGRESAEQLLARLMHGGLGSAAQPNQRP